MGQIAYIDLSIEEVETKPVPERLRRNFLGGRGINMYLLFNHIEKGVQPLSPDNVLIFGAGLLTGIAGIGTSRYNVSGKAPTSGLIGDSNAGGFFGPELRFAGFDHLLIKGRAQEPTYLWIHDNEIEFRDARHLAECCLSDTIQAIREELNDDAVQVAAIGPAGRKLAVFSNIMNDQSNANGHTGMGALMGSKNLWAVALRGTQALDVADPKGLVDVVKKHYRQITGSKGYKATALYGTLFRLSLTRTQGTEPGLNNQVNMMEMGGEELDPDVFIEKYEYAKKSCFNCPVHCKHLFKIESGEHKGLRGAGPEYSSAGWFGSACGSGSWDTILECQHLCNYYGLDCFTVPMYIAWVMELYQRGLIDDKITGGLSLDWGNHHSMTELIHQMGKGEGFGGLLSRGWQVANKELFGEKAHLYERYMPTIKGEPLEGNFRGLRAQALGAATASRGSCHLRSRFTLEEFSLPEKVIEKIIGRPVPPDPDAYEGKAWPVVWTENLCAVGDALGLCRFVTKWMTPGFLAFEEFSELIGVATGMEISPKELMEIGERITNIERIYLAREGVDRKDDRLPDKMYDEPWTHGPRKGLVVDPVRFNRLLDDYYEEHGWDSNGIPTSQTLKRLGLDGEPSRLL